MFLPGLQDDLRVDGRGCEDYRHMEIETDVVSNTDGSAKVTLVIKSGSMCEQLKDWNLMIIKRFTQKRILKITSKLDLEPV